MDQFENLEPREWLLAVYDFIICNYSMAIIIEASYEIARLERERDLDEFE